MNDYKKLYYSLFNEISDTIESLVAVQRNAEENFMEFSAEEDGANLSSSDIGEGYEKILSLIKDKKHVVVSNGDEIEFVVISKEDFEKLQ